MPQIDHRVGQRLERVMQFTDAIEAIEQTPKLVFPGEDPLDRIEAFGKDLWVEEGLAAALGGLSRPGIRIDVGDHAAIENGFPILPAIIDTVQADNGAVQLQTDGSRGFHHPWQCLAQHRRFIPVPRYRDKRRDHIAVPVAEGDHLVALDLLVSAVADVVQAVSSRRYCLPARSMQS